MLWRIFLCLCLLSSCSFRIDKKGEEPVSGKLSFAQVSAQILGPKCAHCHGTQFTEYATVLGLKNEIARRISLADGDPEKMPQGSGPPLTESEKNALLAWITSGAPEVAQPLKKLPATDAREQAMDLDSLPRN